ncbi:MAG: hypothetical protein ABSB74_06680 [Tepidisphaeraceae bacterium]
MKRFRRWLFNGLAALSLVLCMVTAALWARSYFIYEHVGSAVLSRRASLVASFQGQLYLEHHSYWEYSGGWEWYRQRIRPGEEAIQGSHEPSCAWHEFLGFGVGSGTIYAWPGHLYPGVPMPTNVADPRFWRNTFTALAVPYWIIVALLAAGPFWWMHQKRQQRCGSRPDAAICRHCGYDLRATPDRCPECGTIPPKKERLST